jgi:hypothetical protein
MKKQIELTAVHVTVVDVVVYADGVRLACAENIGEEINYHTAIYFPKETVKRVRMALERAEAKMFEMAKDAVQN